MATDEEPLSEDAPPTVHLLMDSGYSRCGNVSSRPGWNRGFAGPLSADPDAVTCRTCLRFHRADHSGRSGGSGE